MYVRQLVVRYFALPPLFEAQMLTRPDPKTGRMHGATYMKDPWYIRPTFLARWGPEAWIQRLWGGSVPGDADKFKPEGFLFEDIGPERRMGKGVDNQVELKRLEAMRGPSESPFRPKAKA